MGVYIKGMEMPKSCCYCAFCDIVLGKEPFCALTTKSGGIAFNPYKGKMKDCQLVEVPTPHGRLIDADALGHFPYNMSFCDGNEADEWVAEAHTVIEAEGNDGSA